MSATERAAARPLPLAVDRAFRTAEDGDVSAVVAKARRLHKQLARPDLASAVRLHVHVIVMGDLS